MGSLSWVIEDAVERIKMGRRIGYLDCLKKQGIVRGFFVYLLLLIE